MRWFFQMFLLLFLCSCAMQETELSIVLNDFSGKLVLRVEQDTVVVEGEKDSIVYLSFKNIVLPALVYLEKEEERDTFFIMDHYKGTSVSLLSPSFVVGGSELERGYLSVKEFLAKRYDIPLEEIGKNIKEVGSKILKKEQQLERLYLQKKRYEEYRRDYVSQTIEMNPTHELSLVLLLLELRDEELAEQLWEKIEIENKESSLYRLVEGKYAGDRESDRQEE